MLKEPLEEPFHVSHVRHNIYLQVQELLKPKQDVFPILIIPLLVVVEAVDLLTIPTMEVVEEQEVLEILIVMLAY